MHHGIGHMGVKYLCKTQESEGGGMLGGGGCSN